LPDSTRLPRQEAVKTSASRRSLDNDTDVGDQRSRPHRAVPTPASAEQAAEVFMPSYDWKYRPMVLFEHAKMEELRAASGSRPEARRESTEVGSRESSQELEMSDNPRPIVKWHRGRLEEYVWSHIWSCVRNISI
jgi:hypothetical protein